MLAAALLLGCHSIPPPQVLAEADQIAEGPAARDARKHAASAVARADELRRQAHAAFEDDRRVDAQFLGEQAVAAYAYAGALSRLARADTEEGRATAALAKAKAALADLQKEQARLDAELAALETRVQVIREAELPASSGAASPERERARREAAIALAGQAKLLCAASALLGAPPAKVGDEVEKELAAAKKSLDAVVAELAAPAASPIDAARGARASCLAVLTRMRRAQTPVSTAPGAGDALLAELSAAGRYSPSRDDRGVVVTVRSPFTGDKLATTAEATLTELVGVSRAHPTFPVIVVLHLDREPKNAEDRSLAEKRVASVAERFRAGGAGRVDAQLAGTALPVVDPAGKDRARNARLEVIFVNPETF